jgi:hypothetical protein
MITVCAKITEISNFGDLGQYAASTLNSGFQCCFRIGFSAGVLIL